MISSSFITHLWTDKVLIPWKQTRDLYIVPLLVLDSSGVHKIGTIVNHIQQLAVEFQHIPGGWTYLCQHVKLSITRSIKKEMMELWEKEMYDGGGVEAWVTKTPSWQLVTEWIIWMCKNNGQVMDQNAWKKKGFEWLLA